MYLLCVHLSCLALGLAAPPEVQAELDKRSALRTLSRSLRETLVSKQYLPLLRDGHKGSWVGSGSVSSWDEPLGFLERKRDVLLDKRSYSDSDLSKITVNEVKFHIMHSEFKFSLDFRDFSHSVAFCPEGCGESILHPSSWKWATLVRTGSDTSWSETS